MSSTDSSGRSCASEPSVAEERSSPPGPGKALAIAVVAGGAVLAAGGVDIVAVLIACAAAAVCGVMAWSGTAGAGAAAGHAATEDAGARLMARQLLPVWKRHLEASRGVAEKGVGGLLESFSSLSDGLAQAAQHAERINPSMTAGAADEALDEHAEEVEQLLQPMRRSREQRDEVVATLGSVADAVVDLRRLAKDLREIAGHTNLVAVNASIEANRAGTGGSGFNVVAQEVRSLAGRATEVGKRLQQQLDAIGETVVRLRRRSEQDSVSDQELDLLARAKARAVAAALVQRMAGTLRGSHELRESALRLRDELERVFMGFQFQDRLSQSLSAIENDLARFHQWAESGEAATPAYAAAWLEALERTYTMEEQRAHHHGNVEVSKQDTVEFF